ncbi:MAG: efflux transporter outer membrane subunit [Puniceicoccales bacterium]
MNAASHPISPSPSRRIRRTAAVFLTLSLVGCSTTPNSEEMMDDVPMPMGWNNEIEENPVNEGATVSIETWWNVFEDPVLIELIDEALTSNPDLLTTLSRIDQARAERGLERAELFPTLNGGISGAGSRERNRDTDTTSSNESYGASLDASWEVDLFGRQQKYLEASTFELEATVEDYYYAQVSLAAEVANTYLNIISSRKQLEILNESVASREETLQVSEWQEAAGEGDVLATQQVKVLVEQARAQIPGYHQLIEESRNALAVLCGTTPANIEALLDQNDSLPDVPAAITIGIPAEVLRQRPDVRSAEKTVEASIARLSATEKSRLPSLTLSGSIGTEAAKAGDFFNPQRIFGNLVGGLTAPIWDAGRISRNIEIQRAVVDQAYFEFEATVLEAMSEVENALSAINRKREEIGILQRAVFSADLSARLAEFQYEEGEEDILTVLETKRTLLGLAQTLVQSQQEEILAHIQLYKALGGGWSAPESFPTVALEDTQS